MVKVKDHILDISLRNGPVARTGLGRGQGGSVRAQCMQCARAVYAVCARSVCSVRAQCLFTCMSD